LQLGYDSSKRSSSPKSIDAAFPITYLENRALLGLGWSHNYDYRLVTAGTNERTVRGYTANSTASKANAIQFVYDENSQLIDDYII
jgi:hypothetical protein